MRVGERAGTATVPTLDDVVCPSCITAMAKQEGDWHLCPACGYETTGYADDQGDPTVREMLHGADTGPTWMDVDLPKFVRWLGMAVSDDLLGNGRSDHA